MQPQALASSALNDGTGSLAVRVLIGTVKEKLFHGPCRIPACPLSSPGGCAASQRQLYQGTHIAPSPQFLVATRRCNHSGQATAVELSISKSAGFLLVLPRQVTPWPEPFWVGTASTMEEPTEYGK